ncbi:hypothetical protein BRC86_08260 [Halobacteriales archaeon QS_3_64_16]|nr:MAG: hypothetical protein BRC86_08260 [Halobacteriales archaeon QS_3_64_16]
MPFRIQNGRPTIVVRDSYDETADLKRAVLGGSVLAVLGSILIGPLPKTTIVGALLAALSFLTQVEEDVSVVEATETGERLPTEGIADSE